MHLATSFDIKIIITCNKYDPHISRILNTGEESQYDSGQISFHYALQYNTMQCTM